MNIWPADAPPPAPPKAQSKPKRKKRNAQKGAPGFLADARQSRPGEAIGGGHFVFRRGSASGRIRAPEFPFEHPTLDAALAERARLAAKYPGERFVVVSEVTP